MTGDSNAQNDWKQFIIYFAQIHTSFRIPEIQSLSKLYDIPIVFDITHFKPSNAFFPVKLRNAKDAEKLCKRSILIKSIIELWGSGITFNEALDSVKSSAEQISQTWHIENPSFKFEVHCYGETLPHKFQQKIIHEFVDSIPAITAEMPVSLKEPQLLFLIYVDYGDDVGRSFADRDAPREPVKVMMGLCAGRSSRHLVSKYNLKKRAYLGTTSMDAELSLVMANQALATAGKLVYDPFVGTGSFLYTCSEFGAVTIGSDLDGRQIRGSIDRGGSVDTNIESYGLAERVLGTLVFDITQHPFRPVPLFNAIVTDPPYGVRAGAKCIAKAGPEVYLNETVDRVPKMEPYEMDQIMTDLINFAAQWLVVGGRLVFWLPTSVYKYSRCDLPTLPCMQLVSTSVQMFGKWCRVLVTMEKISEYKSSTMIQKTSLNPKGHDDFRRYYFEAPPVVESPSLLCVQKLKKDDRIDDQVFSEQSLIGCGEAFLTEQATKSSRGQQKRIARYQKRLEKRGKLKANC